MVEDISTAIDWVHENASQYGGDLNRVYLVSQSAGAHISMLVAINQVCKAIIHLN